jgi:hypothetical protein
MRTAKVTTQKSKRAQRRHVLATAKAKARTIAKIKHQDERKKNPESAAALVDAVTNHTYRHRAKCSCQMCRNPRRSKRKEVTIQEKRAQQEPLNP